MCQKFLNREKWSVAKLTHLGTINQSKSLSLTKKESRKNW
jgi:hypothetical protein